MSGLCNLSDFTLRFRHALAQTKVLRGVILDIQSGERVPFASMRLDKSGYGKLSDSAGGFTFRFEQWPRDTLQISYVGFQTFSLVLDDSLYQPGKQR